LADCNKAIIPIIEPNIVIDQSTAYFFFPAARANVPYEQREQNSDLARLKRRILRSVDAKTGSDNADKPRAVIPVML
jgi:hypothetical protein